MKRKEIILNCTIKGCKNDHHARGLCKSHYKQLPNQKQKTHEYNYKQYHINPQKHIERVMKWRKINVDKVFENNIKYIKKFQNIFNKNSNEWRWACMSWAKFVRERDENECVVCNSTEDLQAHHILYKSYYPELALNENNGITLCIPCHHETHGWNGGIFK